MRGFKKVFLSIGLLSLSGVALAQTTATGSNTLPPPPIAPTAPPSNVPSFPASGSVQPSIDAASNAYLPWLGQNLMNLVAYEGLFWQLQQNDVSGGTAAYYSPVTMTANTQLVPTMASTIQNATAITATNMQNMLAFGGSTTALAVLATTPGTDTTPPSNNGQPASNDAFLNADTILGVQSYDSTNSTIAAAVSQLVMYLTGQAQPLGTLTLSADASTRSGQLQQADVQTYLLESRAAAASQSVAMSNLQYIAQERAIVAGLGKQAGMTTLPTDGTQTPITDASQLQLEQFLVNRRVGNTAWYANVNTASQTAVQRETLFVLAEISRQMFEQKILMERMLAEEIAMQQSTSQINQAKINYDYQSLQSSLSASTSSSSGTGSSSSSSSGTGGMTLTPAQQAALNQAQSGGTTMTPAQQQALNQATGST